MATREEVVALASRDMPAAEIATRLGISRQRVYQIAPEMFRRRGHAQRPDTIQKLTAALGAIRSITRTMPHDPERARAAWERVHSLAADALTAAAE